MAMKWKKLGHRSNFWRQGPPKSKHARTCNEARGCHIKGGVPRADARSGDLLPKHVGQLFARTLLNDNLLPRRQLSVDGRQRRCNVEWDVVVLGGDGDLKLEREDESRGRN